jgi:hypothetical protein
MKLQKINHKSVRVSVQIKDGVIRAQIWRRIQDVNRNGGVSRSYTFIEISRNRLPTSTSTQDNKHTKTL